MSLKSGTTEPPFGAGNLFNQDHHLTSLPAEARLLVLSAQIANIERWYTLSILILVFIYLICQLAKMLLLAGI